MNKKEKFFDTLNNHFNFHNEFPEISQIAEEDIEKIIALYEQEASKEGKDPWHYLYFDELIIMQKCVYEVIKDNVNYSDITDKIEALYQKELNRRLKRTVYSYGEPTNETYRAPYTEMPEYSLVLIDMCSRQMQDAQKFVMDVEHMPLTKIESAISTYEAIKSDFVKVGKQMPEIQEQIVSQSKEMIVRANEERNANIEREKQQREIELISLQQQIIKMENERLEIEKRIKAISSETLGSYYSKQVSQRYPEEYQRFQEYKDQVKNHSGNQSSISDIKAKFSKVSEDLQFYKNVLPEYESFYQRFEEMKNEHQQQRNSKNQEAEPINLSSSISIQQTLDQQNKSAVSQVPESQQKSFNDSLTNEVKQRIIQYMENMDTMDDVKIASIDNVYQEGKYIVVDAKQDNGCFIGAEFTPEDFSRLFIFVKQLNGFNPNELPQSVEQASKSVVSASEVSQNNVSNAQTEEKNRLINDIIRAMLNAGEFNNSGIDINQKMSDIEYAKRNLSTKSIEDLKWALSTYTSRQEIDSTCGMHR